MRARTVPTVKYVVAFLLTLSVVAAACSSEPADNLIGLRASSDPSIGDARFLFAIAEIDGTRRGSPDEAVHVTATSVDDPTQVLEADAEWLWMIQDAIGLYRVSLPFTRAGTWELDWTISTGEGTDPILVLVNEAPTTPAIGEPAPAVATPTTADHPIDEISTDTDPTPGLYTVSLDEALSNGKQTVVIFATPAFCTSAACGPMLETVKRIMPQYPDVNWIHVEVYQGFKETGFQPSPDRLVDAVKAFNLPSEPWVFVMDESGVVKSRLEGAVSDAELSDILDN